MGLSWKAECDAKTACVNMGGSWQPSLAPLGTCDVDAGTDGGGDGCND
jgi:hypothetical protein